MNRRKEQLFKTLARLCITILCMLSLTLSAWADGGPAGQAPALEAPGEDPAGPDSRVITCGTEAAPAAAGRLQSVGVAPGENAKTGNAKKGVSLGMFTTTGYCNCEQCSGGHNLTYSGTVPMAGHTISADISIYPIGTELMIDDVIYTVEDIGSDVSGSRLDIFYDTHEAAVAHGRKSQEAFTVVR